MSSCETPLELNMASDSWGVRADARSAGWIDILNRYLGLTPQALCFRALRAL